MKVGIIETHYHHEFLHTMIQLFDSSVVFTTKEIYNNLPIQSKEKEGVCFHFKHPQQKMKDFIKSIYTDGFDFIFVNTIQPSMVDLPAWRKFKPKCPAILTIHNINGWTNKKFVIRKNILRSVDSYLAGKFCNEVLKKFDFINIVHQPMFKYAFKNFPNHKITFIPYSLAGDVNEKKHETINFVVPGGVTPMRRDYYTVLNAFEDIIKKFDNVKLTLLGKMDWKFEQDLICNYIPSFLNKIKFYTSFVPTEEYNNCLSYADFIVIPSVKKTWTINTASEYYGKTKSPNFNECIKWRKPTIVPDYLEVDSRLESSTIYYTGSCSLYDRITEMLKDKKLIKYIKKEAVKNCNYYNKQNIYKSLMNVIN